MSEGRSLLQRLLAARWTSVACSCVVALAALAIGTLLVGPLRSALLFATVVTLQPMAGVLGSLANSESAALACAAVALAAIAARYRGVAPRRSSAVLAGALVAGVLSRPGFVLALPCLFGLSWLALVRRPRPALQAVATFAPACAVLILYTMASTARLGMHHEIPSSGALASQVARHLLSAGRLFDVWVAQYWLKLGWMDTTAPRAVYVAVAACVALALAGYALPLAHAARDRAVAAVVAAGTALLASMLYVVAWRRGDFLWVQGRYALVLFPAHLYVLARGLSAWRRYLPRAVDPLALFAVVLLLLHVAGALSALRRFYGAGPGGPTALLQGWERAWGLPLLAPTAAIASALALALIAWSARTARGSR